MNRCGLSGFIKQSEQQFLETRNKKRIILGIRREKCLGWVALIEHCLEEGVDPKGGNRYTVASGEWCLIGMGSTIESLLGRGIMGAQVYPASRSGLQLWEPKFTHPASKPWSG